MNTEAKYTLDAVQQAIADAVYRIGDGEEATKMIVTAITDGIESAISARAGTQEDTQSVLNDMVYWLQPWINPYYQDED